MTAIADLITAYTTEVATISDTLRNAQATYKLSILSDALTKQALLESSAIVSYTIADRTVTRRNVDVGKALIKDLENELYTLIYGPCTQVDMGGNQVRNIQ